MSVLSSLQVLERFRLRSEEILRMASRQKIDPDSIVSGFRIDDARAVLSALAAASPVDTEEPS